jgi:hypothetical protein
MCAVAAQGFERPAEARRQTAAISRHLAPIRHGGVCHFDVPHIPLNQKTLDAEGAETV